MSFAEWNWNLVDLVILALILFGIVGGFLKGFTWQVVRLSFLVLAFFLAFRFCVPVGEWVGKLTRDRMNPTVNKSLAYAVIFGFTYLGSWPLAILLRKGIAKLQLRSYDRMVGAMLGFFKTTAVAYVLLLIVLFFAPRVLSEENRIEDLVERSIAYRVVSEVNPTLSGLLPPEFHDRVNEVRDQIARKIDEVRTDEDPTHVMTREGELPPAPPIGDGSETGEGTDPLDLNDLEPADPTASDEVPASTDASTDKEKKRPEGQGTGETAGDDATRKGTSPAGPYRRE